jgi:hypothetical protein
MDHPELVDFYVSEIEKAASIAAAPATPPTPTQSLDAPIQKGWLETEILRQYEQIRQFALQDPFKPHSNEDFEAAAQSMLFFARERANLVRPQIDRHFGR